MIVQSAKYAPSRHYKSFLVKRVYNCRNGGSSHFSLTDIVDT